MKYFLAIIACIALALAYVAMGVTFFGWENGGGVLPIMLLMGVMKIIWDSITKPSK